MTTIINNLPDYYTAYPFLVARRVDDDWWFYGSYNTRERAADVAWREDGEVFTSDEVIKGDL
jgi:hypothetical protein